MTEQQQQFRPGDRVKVTMELTVVDPKNGVYVSPNQGTAFSWTVERWANECDHITVELIERPKPPREPGWYPCNLDGGRTIYLLHWDGEFWHWSEDVDRPRVLSKVTVVGAVTLHLGVEL